MDSGIPWRRVILMSPHQATDSGTGPDDWVSVRPTIFVAPLFDSCSGCGSKGDRMQGICMRTWSVRETYAERTQDERTQHRLARFLDVLDGLFLAGFLEISAVSSRISSFSQILGLSESRRQSPGWHSLDGNLPILFLALPLRVRHVQEQLGSAAPPGQPFLLDYMVYASSSSTSSGVLGRWPWGTQGLLYVTLNKEFSFREEVRPWSRSC